MYLCVSVNLYFVFCIQTGVIERITTAAFARGRLSQLLVHLQVSYLAYIYNMHRQSRKTVQICCRFVFIASGN